MTDQVRSLRFREVQRFRQAWIWAVVVLAAIAGWLPLVRWLVSSDAEDRGPLWLALVLAAGIGCGLPILFWSARLAVEVTDDEVDVRYRPFAHRHLPLSEVVRAEAVSYRPVRDYGGWGIKGWSRRKMAYNVSGSRGVLLTLSDGRTVLVGSQHADELCAAVLAAIPRGRPRR